MSSFFARNGPLVQAVADASATDEQIEQGYRGFVNAFVDLIARGLDGLVERGSASSPATPATSPAP